MQVAAPGGVRLAAAGGILGPVVFVSTWAIAGALKSGYSPLHDPISDLAGVHASTRPAMSAAFVVFAVGMIAYGYALRATRMRPVAAVAAISGLATLGVAAFPLHHSATVDTVHGVFAGTGYVTLAATALWSAVILTRAGVRSWARVALVSGTVCAIALACTMLGSFGGTFQRLGLTAGDVWVVSSAVGVRRRAPALFAQSARRAR